MGIYIFLGLQYLIQLIRGLLFPLFRWPLYWLVPFFRQRIDFELKNFKGEESRPFNKDIKPSFTFEISSEGELDQIGAVIDHFLEKGLRVEILYSSHSLETKLLKLYHQWPNLIRLYRLPLLTYFFWTIKGFSQNLNNWSNGRHLIFCRYDFFPELILLSRKKENVYIYSATLKNKKYLDQKGFKFKAWYLKQIYLQMDMIICSIDKDYHRFLSLGIESKSLFVCDLRPLKIKKRLDAKEITFAKIPQFQRFLTDTILSYPREHRIIFGSLWPTDLRALSNTMIDKIKIGEVGCVIAPHQFGKPSLSLIEAFFKENHCPYYFVTEENLLEVIEFFNKNKGVMILLIKGVLCELYTLFGHSYVGGGFERSVHSLLEPAISGSIVYCGPKTHRSTEYDLIKEKLLNPLLRLEDASEFSAKWLKHAVKGKTIYNNNNFVENMRFLEQNVLEKIERSILLEEKNP